MACSYRCPLAKPPHRVFLPQFPSQKLPSSSVTSPHDRSMMDETQRDDETESRKQRDGTGGTVTAPRSSFGAGGPVPELVRRMLAEKRAEGEGAQSEPAINRRQALAGWSAPHSSRPAAGTAEARLRAISAQPPPPPPGSTPSGHHLRGPTQWAPSHHTSHHASQHGSSGQGQGLPLRQGLGGPSQGLGARGGQSQRSYPNPAARGGTTHRSSLRRGGQANEAPPLRASNPVARYNPAPITP